MADVDLELVEATDDLDVLAPRLITGNQLTRQRVRYVLQLFQGEWFLALDQGLPLIDWLTAKDPDLQPILSTMEAKVRRVPGVITTRNSSIQRVERDIKITMEVVYSDGAVEQLFIGATPRNLDSNGTPFHIFFTGGTTQGVPF